MPSMHSLPRRQVLVTFIGVLMAIFLGALDQTIVATAMPDIIAQLGGFSHYTFVTTAYLVTSTVMIPITGRITDIFGRKWFYTVGIMIFVIGSLLSGLSQTLTQLVIFRALQGIGGGIMIANAFATIGDLYPPAERGKYQGFISGVFGLSSVIGPTLGGFITDSISWHWIFFINVPLGIGVIALFIIAFPNLRPPGIRQTVDYAGRALLILTVVPLLLALSWGGTEYPWVSAEVISLLSVSLVSGIIFLLIERRKVSPLLPLRYFTDRVVSISMAVTFFTGFGMFGAIVFVPLFFQGVLGLSATAGGTFLTPMMLGVVTGSLASGQALSRTGGHYRLQGIIGTGVMAIGLALLSRLTLNTSYVTAVLYIILTGLGLGVTFPLYTVAAQNSVPYAAMGVVVSSIPFSRFIGGTLGLAILGSIVNSHFAADFLSRVPDSLNSAIPSGQLDALAQSPQALISSQAQAQLQTVLGHNTDLYNQVIQSLREALTSALTEAFLIALAAVVAAFIINLFIREIPLRRQHEDTTRE